MTIGYLELTLQGVKVEFVVEYEYESDEPEVITECFIIQHSKHNGLRNAIDIMELLTDEHITQLGQQAIENLEYLADRRAALSEDAADSRAQMAREIQAETLQYGVTQRGVKL